MTKEQHPAMDYKMHNDTYANFIKGCIYSGIVCAILTVWAVIAIAT
ncbi:MAG: aa3-type cytochrome c oxidase subunit IV [Rhizobiales bacterium]|nr:aa3-type cytochrome c oxidase subunit IV [Hyphomicrobiales bacterium]NRB14197.1 aa3-type cytochrome c oxidase subunit IV [Hyphomicrobiales bacterium]